MLALRRELTLKISDFFVDGSVKLKLTSLNSSELRNKDLFNCYCNYFTDLLVQTRRCWSKVSKANLLQLIYNYFAVYMCKCVLLQYYCIINATTKEKFKCVNFQTSNQQNELFIFGNLQFNTLHLFLLLKFLIFVYNKTVML